ncbi:hypothetical protein [uncultured Alteromonas sp.]|jgi:hypothetical protein|uniref:hypothetical protein n=1 Tax=uncultured Alteromonas sp. TaxID=179113 RepID=UPI0025EFC84B|nr:hypothetical protein [uncultured Alteromonas sp.]
MSNELSLEQAITELETQFAIVKDELAAAAKKYGGAYTDEFCAEHHALISRFTRVAAELTLLRMMLNIFNKLTR